jgi:hypothetical protein
MPIEAFKEKYPKLYQKVASEIVVEYVEGILISYNAWLAGDCYGVCVDTFNAAGELVEDDACWGFIGLEYARQEVKGWLAHRSATPEKEKAA